jgi:hypothetical protein
MNAARPQCKTSITVIFVSLVFVLGFPNQSRGDSVKVDTFRRHVSNSIANIQNQCNMLITVSNSLWVADSEKTEIRHISYLISGGNYRTKMQWSTSNLHNINEYQISYNGERFASFQGNIEQITYSRFDPAYDPFVPISPITACLVFLSRDGDACPACIIRVKDVITGEASEMLKNSQITEDQGTSTNESEAFILPSNKTGGLASYWRIALIKRGNMQEITSVTKFIGAGEFKGIFKFSDYTNIVCGDGNLSFPMVITMEAYTGSNLFKTELTRVMAVKLDPPIPEHAFDVAGDLNTRAKRILNADSKSYERLPGKSEQSNVKYRTARNVVYLVFGLLSIGMLWMLSKTTKSKS